MNFAVPSVLVGGMSVPLPTRLPGGVVWDEEIQFNMLQFGAPTVVYAVAGLRAVDQCRMACAGIGVVVKLTMTSSLL